MTDKRKVKFCKFISLTLTASLLGMPAFSQPSSEEQKLDVDRFVNIIDVIKKDYALTVDDKKLLENAIRGMVSNLDPHSEYLDEDAYRSLLTTTTGEFGGLGVEVITQYGVLKVVSPIDGTPAAKAGIKAGDYIVALDNKSISEITPDKAVTQMRGKKGSHILLTIIRKDEKQPLKFDLVRDTIHIDTLKSKLVDNNIGYVRISQFQEATGDLMTKAINSLEAQAKDHHLQGLVLDLRNNPGGLLETAVNVVNNFLESDKINRFDKVIVYTEGRVPDSQYKAHATGHDILKGAPIVVLINEGSASASEIVAGALQDYRRAVIAGSTSFGKGSVQTVLPLDTTHAVKLTTALYLTPAGRIIQNKGIVPDVFIPAVKVAEVGDSDALAPMREMQLKDRLNGVDDKNALAIPHDDLAKLAKDDFQLYEAVNILKTMSFAKNSLP